MRYLKSFENAQLEVPIGALIEYNRDNHVRLERLEVLNGFSMTCGPPLWASTCSNLQRIVK